MSKLRFVVAAQHYYPDHPNGADRLAFDEAVFLANRGNEVWLVAQDLTRSKPEFASQGDLRILRYPSPQLAPFSLRRMGVHQQCTRDILRRYLRAEPDIVHGHSLLTYDGALSLFGRTAQTCFSVHSPVYLETRATSREAGRTARVRSFTAARLLHRIEHNCLLRSNIITVESSYTKSLIQQLHGSQIAQQTSVVPGWVDLDRFRIVPNRQSLKRKLGWPLELPVLFTLRRLVPRMGLDRLLYAAEQLRSSGRKFCLMIGGAGPLSTELRKLVQTLNLEQEVRFLGRVPEDDLPLAYAAADAFVLPTTQLECFGIIALEALACGRPVLATPIGAIPELFERIDRAWLARDASAEAIARLLMDFLDGMLPQRTPEDLRQMVAGSYSKDRVLETMLTTLTEGLAA